MDPAGNHRIERVIGLRWRLHHGENLVQRRELHDLRKTLKFWDIVVKASVGELNTVLYMDQNGCLAKEGQGIGRYQASNCDNHPRGRRPFTFLDVAEIRRIFAKTRNDRVKEMLGIVVSFIG